MTLARVLLHPLVGTMTAFAVDVDKIVGLVERTDGVFVTVRRHENGAATTVQISDKFDGVFAHLNRGLENRIAVDVVSHTVKRMAVNTNKITGLMQYVDGSIILGYKTHEHGNNILVEISGDFESLYHKIS